MPSDEKLLFIIYYRQININRYFLGLYKFNIFVCFSIKNNKFVCVVIISAFYIIDKNLSLRNL